jgi:TM2 domain-containing membrane protein YozV
MQVPEDNLSMLHSSSPHNPTTILIVSIVIGELGVDRFLIGDIGLGIAKLLTLGGCGIWWVIDMCIIMKATREKNMAKLMTILDTMSNYGPTNNYPPPPPTGGFGGSPPPTGGGYPPPPPPPAGGGGFTSR